MAAARAAHFVCRDPKDDERRLFLPLKNNLSPDKGGLSFKIDGAGPAPRIVWDDGPVFMTADEALASGSEERGTKEAAAAAWLSPRLVAGPAAVTLLQAEASTKGFSWRTVERAKVKLGVAAKRIGGIGEEGEWHWLQA
ncbi:MAG: hypothetical protein EXQ88_05090 [Alphaproteobacteria bacterium]|nr:hypothetical protein [Alphaproteobacteria bacterium]